MLWKPPWRREVATGQDTGNELTALKVKVSLLELELEEKESKSKIAALKKRLADAGIRTELASVRRIRLRQRQKTQDLFYSTSAAGSLQENDAVPNSTTLIRGTLSFLRPGYILASAG